MKCRPHRDLELLFENSFNAANITEIQVHIISHTVQL
jgi:hypothetical protein